MILRLLFSGVLLAGACSGESQVTTLEEDSARLEQELERIIEYAASEQCVDEGEWKFAPYGAKPCGGPWGYIAYSVKVDESRLQEMLDKYHASNKALNEKWGIFSDCAMAQQPSRVACEDGKAVLVYD